MTWTPYKAAKYVDSNAVEKWCNELAQTFPQWVKLETIGTTVSGKNIQLLTLGEQSSHPENKPAFWMDGGTHATEWTGVMCVMFSISQWMKKLQQADAETITWFQQHTVFAAPCISPDGLQATFDGTPAFRSTLRPDKQSLIRKGHEPCDIDGDGAVRQMRWKHPCGSFVQDEKNPGLMRERKLSDTPENAYFVCSEGTFLNWDKDSFVTAPLTHGFDLNRNFPSDWKPYDMFGMDGGDYCLSEEESNSVVKAFASRPYIAAAVTNHTYTGCILTAPAKPNSPLPDADILTMEILAQEAAEGTGYKVFRMYPNFVYDEKKLITGTWQETMSDLFGIPAYTLELWNPYAFAGVDVKDPAKQFSNPDPEVTLAILKKFSQMPSVNKVWTEINHPQLGKVEVGGIDASRSVRNPPENLLNEECSKGFKIIDTIRKSLPQVRVSTRTEKNKSGETTLELTMQNRGYLSTSGLQIGEKLRPTPNVTLKIKLSDGVKLTHGENEQVLAHLSGWGNYEALKRHALYPALPAKSHQSSAKWAFSGNGTIEVEWFAGKGGYGKRLVEVG